jgi:hypothetical protein
MTNLRIAVFALCLSVAMLFSGCATNVVITPEIAVVSGNDFTLGGKIDYEGSKEYLPRTIFSDTNPAPPLLILRYRYDVTYGRDAVHQALPLFNPLTIVGFPIGADTAVVTGKLEILKGSSAVKTYSAVCVLDKHRTIFSEGETMSEMRKRGLLAVRDNIEYQMYADRDLLCDTDR